MCAIVGNLSFNGTPTRLNVSNLTPIRHRGPDGEGFYNDNRISLGHTRLAIIDLSEQAKQPMFSHDRRYVITYNGEIYNYLELRSQLESNNAAFTTNSDTEVVIEAYRHWGQNCVKYFRGMFAFALWDTLEETLFLARDRCGERPLIYYYDTERFIFASELKALVPLLPQKPELDLAAVDMYLHYQYTPEPFTLFHSVFKLPSAHTLTIFKKHIQIEPVRYWDIENTPAITGLPTGTPGILNCIREAMEEAVKLTLRADVPVAVALSGGIDSGAIAVLAQKNYPEPMHAFSVGYPGRPPYDEREQAKELADKIGMIFHEVELPIDQFVDFFPEMIKIMDEPIADIAAFGHYSVPKAAREMGIKVLLSGIGGDEIFWGYNWVNRAARINQRPPLSPRLQHLLRTTLPKRLLRRLPIYEYFDLPSIPKDYLYFNDITPDFSAAKRNLPTLYGSAMQNLSALNAYTPVNIGFRSKEQIPSAIIRLLFDTWLVGNCLTLGDRVSMSTSVETRMPFLDSNLIELLMALRRRIPDHHLGQKAWLRASLKNILPNNVLTRPKRGFRPPVQEWINGVVTRYKQLIPTGKLVQMGIINSLYSHEISNTTLHSTGDSLFIIYKIILLEMWYQDMLLRFYDKK